jgi:primosomal protein N' (replication factor Y)
MDQSLFETRPASTGLYVRVAVERAIDEHAGALTYELGPDDADVGVGERVLVPLASRTTEGVVVARGGAELLAGLAASRVRPISRRLGVRLPPALVELGEWMSEYYLCPLGMTLATMTPAAVKKRTGRRVTEQVDLVDHPDESAQAARLTPTARRARAEIMALPRDALPMPSKALATRIGAASVAPINRLIEAGLLRTVQRESIAAPPPLWERYRTERAAHEAPTPTEAQQRVIDGVSTGFGSFQVHLLRGVTGSGKTEVYIRLIERVLALGKTGLVLVPEIALTPQTAGRLIDRFVNVGVAVLHSGLTASERHRQWASAAAGEARVVIGARSAIFAPVQDLGLIVVDEEHDTSYKQDQLPRYNARDVGVKRAQVERVPILLASATPSLESYANAKAGRYMRWALDERVGPGRLPQVRIVDLGAERRALAAQGAPRERQIGPILQRALGDTLEAGAQAILLLNRRGFANHIACTDVVCGWSMRCAHCDVGMVLHRGAHLPKGHVVRCHHCHSEQRVPDLCPVCSRRVGTLGAGTQRLEEELSRLFPGRLVEGDTLLRLDSDTMRTARDYFEALSRFGAGEVRVLVGTQMVAKGLDYPNVRLVGVVNADTALGIPDFRAAERTFQLVSQVSGRAGRGSMSGQVIVQTLEPDTPAIALAAAHDYERFAAREFEFRRAADLPPVSRMVRIVVRDEDLDRARGRAGDLAEAIRREAGPGVRIDGPMPCVISRIAGRFRFGIEITGSTPGIIQAPLRALRARGLLHSDAGTVIDCDPIALL